MLRSSFVEETANPWSPSSAYIQVGSLQNILSFAEKSGHLDRRTIKTEEIMGTVDKISPSVALIRLLREITRLGKALDKVNIEIQSHLKEAATKDITHVDVMDNQRMVCMSGLVLWNIELQYINFCHLAKFIMQYVVRQRCQQIDNISSQLSVIIEKKDELLSRLQQPLVGEFLEIDAAHHKNTAEVFPMIASNLASFPTLLENIAWIRKFSLADGQLYSRKDS
ncbi:uncharacterized protein [Montipora foliosa]|uniref:uncharacterized protein isoform X3 n=1 Tax=Montipora foliosa TaxID=591990 RepID=UPI0035F13D1C